MLSYLALAAVSIIWGTTYLALRIGVKEFPPFLLVAIRQTTAGMLVLAALFFSGTRVQLPAALLGRQTVAGFLMITLGNGLVAWSEVYIPSGVAAVLCSALPVAVILVNLAAYGIRPSATVVVGTVIGLAGMLLMFSEHLDELVNKEYRLGIGCTLLAVLSWAAGSVWLKSREGASNPFLNAGLQMLTGGVLCLPFSLWLDGPHPEEISSTVLYALGYLVLFGSVIAYASYLYALKTLPLAVVSLYAYINPVVAVILGWVVLDEKLNLKIGIAVAIVLLGIFLVNRAAITQRLRSRREQGAVLQK
ncbi:MAG: drug/metabolite exporter YedA [Cyclobacteriaceae bacterium]|nr:MAG: drug/metabolite exporter YedA [Cyclobacteriaceae bacterium]